MVGQVGPEGTVETVVFFSKTLTLDNDEILAMLNDGAHRIEVLAAPGEGKAYSVYAIFFTADKRGGAYTFTGNALIGLFLEGGGGPLPGGVFNEEAADAYPLFASGNSEKISTSLRGQFSNGGDGSPSENFDNASLVVNFWTAPTSVGGGNSANSLTITIQYGLVDV